MTKQIVMNLLADRPIAYHPDIARITGSVKAGIFLSQLLYWSDKGTRTDGYIWKTQEDWETETALTRYEQEGARRELKKRGLIEEKLKGIPAKLYYKVNTDLLYQMLDAHYSQSSLGKTNILDTDFSPNSEGENQQTITESTQETTTKITTEGEAATPQPPARQKREPINEIPQTINTQAFRAMWEQWRIYKGSSIKAMTYNRQLARAEKDAAVYGIDRVVALYNLTMDNGWKGVPWERLTQSSSSARMPAKQLQPVKGEF